MQKSEMRLVLFLLQDKTNISKTYRQMAKETGLSLGSVQGVMSDLAERGFVVETSAGRILRKRMFLIDRWARDYSEGRKKKQLICRFRFLAESVREHWADILLSHRKPGGEENRQHFLEMGIFALKNGMYMSKNQPTVSLLPVE